MSYLQKAKSVVTCTGSAAQVRRCERCLELEAKGVATLLCSRCGYVAESPARKPHREELAVSASRLRRQLPRLTPGERETFDYWLDVYLSFGWSREETERAALSRTLRTQGLAAATREPRVRGAETSAEEERDA